MKLKRIGQNETELHFEDGTIVLFSYETPVAMLNKEGEALCTTKKYSSTTSAHINKAVKRWCAPRVDGELKFSEIVK